MVTTRPRGRPAKDAEPAPDEEDVLRAALHSFAVHGFNGVSVRTLNKELGVSHNLLYQRYGTKDDIWRAAVSWGFGRIVARLEAADDPQSPPLERLRSIIRAFVLVSAEHPDLMRLINVEGGQHSDRLEYLTDRILGPETERIRRIWSAAVERGEAKDVPFETVFFLITSGGAEMFASRALTERLFGEAPLDPERRLGYVERFADLIMDAIRA
ncbi:TetR/AcrR family transcriptional regulator [Glycomyces sp. NPDC048151]|uniref:TetR/AcrR family transcriptional regulator n=1 Tax=Glycomyces sp. NPDC048151 TaxID=3364002 RepID=UPI00371004C4